MSGTYRAAGGEGWSDVARSATGNDIDASKIARANPGVPVPIPAGTLLQIPFPQNEVVTGTAAELELVVNSEQIGTFDNFSLALSIDAIAKCSFTVPNEPETRAIFAPLSSPTVEINANGVRIFTGRSETPSPANEPESRSLEVSCYSSPGILERANPPLSAFPLEYTNANLTAIAEELCAFHGISIDWQASSGAIFERVDIGPNDGILSFLSDLAAQRGPVITSNAFGQLVFWNSVSQGSPVARYEKGYAPAQRVATTISEENYYSSVTGYVPSKTKKNVKGERFTVENPYATDIVRPYTFEAEDISPGELETAVQSTAGRMFAGVFSAGIEIATWYTEDGEMFQPNTTMELKSPDDYINDFYEFLVTDVVLSKAAGVEVTSMTLALPGAFSGEIPSVMPWQ